MMAGNYVPFNAADERDVRAISRKKSDSKLRITTALLVKISSGRELHLHQRRIIKTSNSRTSTEWP